MLTVLFITVYAVIALACLGLGWYLSESGKTLLTLPGDVLKLLPRRSRPVPVDQVASAEPKTPSFFSELSHDETQYDLVTPPITPASDASHEEVAQPDAVSKIVEGTLQSKFFAGPQSEPEPAESVHDEP